MEQYHKTLNPQAWSKLSLAEQLGNVGSEYGRAVSWRKKNNSPYFEKAFDRMLELLDLTINDKRWQNHRLKELLRLREAACGEFFGDEKEPQSLEKYFLQFATLARAGK